MVNRLSLWSTGGNDGVSGSEAMDIDNEEEVDAEAIESKGISTFDASTAAVPIR